MQYRVYLNNAAGSWPKAPGVSEIVKEYLETFPSEPGRSADESASILDRCRCELAKVLNIIEPGYIAIFPSATYALNAAILGWPRQSKARIITTIAEHNSVIRPVMHLNQNFNVPVEIVGLDESGDYDIDQFVKLKPNEHDLVILNHASNVTGRIFSVDNLFDIAKRAGATTLLDASQTIGKVSINAKELNADMIAFAGHKGLHGPLGAGGLYVSPSIILNQTFVGGTGILSESLLHPNEMPLRLEAGTPNIPAIAGLKKALKWVQNESENLNRNLQNLYSSLLLGLREMPGVQIYGNIADKPNVGIVSFTVDGWTVDDIGYALSESFGIVCRTGLHCAPLIHKAIGSFPNGTVRFSLSGLNTEADIELALKAVERLANGNRRCEAA